MSQSVLQQVCAMSLDEFQTKLGNEICINGGSQWLVDIGYRKDDKDMGYRRYHEILAAANMPIPISKPADEPTGQQTLL